ncbi:MAG: starch-binding protein [Lachnospiraceae bacterium]|nr:starch-binding protein [Lachnospiraceae bacterium]
MKKNILKVLASMLVLAMAITAIVVPVTSAKAADKETEFVIVLADTETRVAKVLLDFDWNGAGLVPDGTKETDPVGWGRDMYSFAKDNSANIYRMKLTGVIDAVNDSSKGATIQFLFLDSSGNMIEAVKFPLWDTKADNVNAYKNNDVLYFSVNVSGSTTWAEIPASTVDPTAITAAEVIAEIGKIGTVELDDGVKVRIEAARNAFNSYKGNVSDITNYATLTAAETQWSTLMAAGAGELTLHVKTSWTKLNLYGWDGADLGGWPGKAVSTDELNDGWYTITTTLTQAANLILNNGSEQTADWKYVSAGEIWVTMSGTNFTPSTTAPEGWVTEAPQPSESEDPSESEEPSGSENPSESEDPSEEPSESEDPSEEPSESEKPSEKPEAPKYEQKYESAIVVGNFSGLTNCNIATEWDVQNKANNMEYLGNGVYKFVLTFDKTTAPVEIEYKIAFNNSWDVNIGLKSVETSFAQNGSNIKVTIPAGVSSFTIVTSEQDMTTYDSITNADKVSEYISIAATGDFDMTAVLMLLLAGCALVSVGVVSKKRFA